MLLNESTLLFAEFVFELDVLLVPVGEVGHVPVVELLAHEARADALLGIRPRRFLPNFALVISRRTLFLVTMPLLGLVSFVDGVVLILSL